MLIVETYFGIAKGLQASVKAMSHLKTKATLKKLELGSLSWEVMGSRALILHQLLHPYLNIRRS